MRQLGRRHCDFFVQNVTGSISEPLSFTVQSISLFCNTHPPHKQFSRGLGCNKKKQLATFKGLDVNKRSPNNSIKKQPHQ